jgi:hypothetical protein
MLLLTSMLLRVFPHNACFPANAGVHAVAVVNVVADVVFMFSEIIPAKLPN